jgi:type IV secretory pathway VirB10-like protein
MKQCPVCNETFDDQKAFCDMDGSALVDQTDSLRAALSQANQPSSSASASAWVTGTIGALIGIIICVLLYMLFILPGKQAQLEQDRHATETKETTPVKPNQMALVPVNNQIPVPSPIPSETESPAAQAPSPAAPAATPPPPLDNGPIATGTKEAAKSEHAIIKMKDGTTVEADAAWEDAQGVWFRRSGLVSFVEKSRVEAITEPQRKPAATESKTP